MMQLKDAKIGFIGAGNMASAVINGLINGKVFEPKDIYVSDPDKQKLESFKKLNIHTNGTNEETVKNCDYIILAVKPNVYDLVLKQISKLQDLQDKVFISIAAGISIQYIKKYFSFPVKVVRVMPNTPALIGEGMTMTCCAPPVEEKEFELVNQIFNSVGKTETIDEEYMNEIIAVNSSSPAYVYIMIEAMADAAVMSGIPREMAYRVASQAVAGAAKMVLETGMHPAALKDMVCSPGGTTIQAVHQLEKAGFRACLMDAMEKCTEKAIELNKKYI